MALTGDWSLDLTPERWMAQAENWLREVVNGPDLDDPMATYRYIRAREEARVDAYRQRPLIRLWDKHHRPVADLTGEKSLTFEEVMTDAGAANLVLRHDNWLSKFLLYDRRAEEDLHLTIDPNPYNRNWRRRWGGKITGADAVRGEDGLYTVELEAIHNRAHAQHILCGANPVFPPEVQLPKAFFLPWNMRTAGMIITFINLARQFFPLLSIPTNIANPGSWLGVRDIIGGLDPLAWPIQVQFVNPLFDQSRTTVLTSRWNDLHQVTLGPMTDCGTQLRAYTWLKEDDDSPHPELGVVGDALARPHGDAAVVLAFEDKSGVTGLTGTLIDGPINLIASTADDLITETVANFVDLDKDGDGKTDPFIRKLLGAAPAKPKVVFREGEHTGIISARRSMKGATAKTIMVGGRSPGIVNQLQTFGIKFGLSQLQTVITTGVVEQTGQAPVGSGLEEIYQGQLDDTLLAWQRFTDPRRAMLMGDFGFLEHREQGSGSAYTVSGVLDLRTGHYKTRAYTSFRTQVRNGRPWLLDEHFTLGDRLAFQVGSVLHVDQLTGWRRSYDENSAMKVELSIGDDLDQQDAFAQGMKTLSQVWGVLGTFFGSESLF